jgi:hypothetical protein
MASRPAKKRKVEASNTDDAGNGDLSDSMSSSPTEGDVESDQGHQENSNEASQPATREQKREDPARRSNARSLHGFDGSEMALARAASKSNFFRLQVEDLLAEIRPNHERLKAKLEGHLHRVKQIIEQMPNRGPLSVSSDSSMSACSATDNSMAGTGGRKEPSNEQQGHCTVSRSTAWERGEILS